MAEASQNTTISPTTGTQVRQFTSIPYVVARCIVQHVRDYPSLICLSMTNRLFHYTVHSNKQNMIELFDRLESLNFDGIKNHIHYGFYAEHLGPTHTFWYDYAMYPSKILLDADQPLPHDIFRYNTGALRNLCWLPCYGCKAIKRRNLDFFTDQVTASYDLVCDSAQHRRCAGCLMGKTGLPSDRWNPKTTRKRQSSHEKKSAPVPYLQRMPERVMGFQLRCAHCRSVEWVMQKPRKRQERKGMCDACFAESLNVYRPEEIWREGWESFAGIEVEPNWISKKVLRGVEGGYSDREMDECLDDDGHGCDGSEDEMDLIALVSNWNPFEVLMELDSSACHG